MADTPAPVTEDAFMLDRQQNLDAFWLFVKRSTIAAIVMLVLMALFLV